MLDTNIPSFLPFLTDFFVASAPCYRHHESLPGPMFPYRTTDVLMWAFDAQDRRITCSQCGQRAIS